MFGVFVVSSSSDNGKQIILLHYSQNSLWISVYTVSFKPYMHSAIAICLSASVLTLSDLLRKRKVFCRYIHSFDIVIVATSRYVEEPAHFTYAIFILVAIDHHIFYACSHFLSVSERKSRISSFSISNCFIFASLRARIYLNSVIFVSSLTI